MRLDVRKEEFYSWQEIFDMEDYGTWENLQDYAWGDLYLKNQFYKTVLLSMPHSLREEGKSKKFKLLCKIIFDEIFDFYNFIEDVSFITDMQYIEGKHLDRLGNNYGYTREEFESDEEFKERIKLFNGLRNRPSSIPTITEALYSATELEKGSFYLEENPDGADNTVVYVPVIKNGDANKVINPRIIYMLTLCKSAGVRISISASDLFSWEDFKKFGTWQQVLDSLIVW